MHPYLPLVRRSRNFQYEGLRFCTSITAWVTEKSCELDQYLPKKGKMYVRMCYLQLGNRWQ